MPSQNSYALTEKRLKPIYEFLDNGNNKKAINEADKVIRKQKDLVAAKVLKVIALQRYGRSDEAFKLSTEVVELKPTDENSLQGMSLYYKESGQTELISPLYEAAEKLVPNNEELLTHLFMSYVRHDNFPKMKTTAAKLYKKYKSAPYLYWNIMSSVLQADNAENEELAKKMHLPLAEKMIERHMAEGNMESPAEVKLYLLVLRMMGKHQKALEVLESDIAKKLLPPVINGYTPEPIKLKMLMGKFGQVNIESQKYLKENPDSWNYILTYLDSFDKLFAEGKVDEETENAHHTIEQAIGTIEELIANQLEDGKIVLRGPYLFRLEFARRLDNVDKLEQGFERGLKKVEDMLLDYTAKFLHKPCCFSDIRQYLALLKKQENVDRFVEGLEAQRTNEKKFCDCNKQAASDHSDQVRHVSTELFKRVLGFHERLDNSEKVKLSDELFQKFMQSDEKRSSTEKSHLDYNALIAVMLLLDIHHESGDKRLLLKCASMLEMCVRNSPANSEAKFYLVRVYGKLGMFIPCADLYDTMDVKYVQHATLGYLLCRYMSSLGHDNASFQICQLAQNYFHTQRKDCTESLITCYRNGSFEQIIDFLSYRATMEKSLHNYTTKMESSFVDLVYRWKANDKIDEFCYKELLNLDFDINELLDHRDFGVLIDFNPEGKRRNDEDIKDNFNREKDWLKFRRLLLASLYYIGSNVQGAESSSLQANGNNQELMFDEEKLNFAVIRKIMTELSCGWCDVTEKKYQFDGPLTTRIPLCHEAKYRENVHLLLQYCLAVMTSSCRGPDDDVMTKLTETSSKVVENLKAFMESEGMNFEVEGDENSESQDYHSVLMKFNSEMVERRALLSEMFSVTAIFVTSMKKFVKEMKTEMQRKRRKKKQVSSVKKDIVENYQHFCNELSQLGDEMVKSFNKCRQFIDDKMQIDQITQQMHYGMKFYKRDELEDKSLEDKSMEDKSMEDKSMEDKSMEDGMDEILIWNRIISYASASYSTSIKQQSEVVQLRLANLNAKEKDRRDRRMDSPSQKVGQSPKKMISVRQFIARNRA